MTATAVGTRPPARGRALGSLLRAPWSGTTWRGTAHLLVGLPIALLASTVLLALASAVLSLAVTAVFAVPFLAAMFPCSRRFTAWQLSRYRAMLGIELPAPDERVTGLTWLRRLRYQVALPGTWRRITYHALSGFVSLATCGAVLAFWTFGALFSTVAIHGWALPNYLIAHHHLHTPLMMGSITVVGLVLLFAAPSVVELATALDVALFRAAVAPSRSERLAQRVRSLSESRADVISAADAERRRIERDLHDGTQQRLVSLAMNLGVARTVMVDVPPDALAAVERAHEEAKQALSELRDLVRGLHPAILDDLGLDAALSGIAARSPVPVRLMVDLPNRPRREAEAVAYFVVSEALTNVAKHARATQVDLVVELADDVLRIIVSDDGQGGADPARGTGLAGLRQRAESLDGTMTLSSRPDGGTLLVVELPCAS